MASWLYVYLQKIEQRRESVDMPLIEENSNLDKSNGVQDGVQMETETEKDEKEADKKDEKKTIDAEKSKLEPEPEKPKENIEENISFLPSTGLKYSPNY